MKLATLRLPEATVSGLVTAAAVLDPTDGGYTIVEGVRDVGALLQFPDWRERAAAADGPRVASEGAHLAQPVLAPGKVICVGLNYRSHILEMGRDLPAYPTLFAKFAETLTGPTDPVEFVAEDPELDWEGELALIIGTAGRRIPEESALDHVAGYTVANDISMRAWQFRTKEWLQGKVWEGSTPVGPILATADEVDFENARLTTTVNDSVMQDHSIADLLFSPAFLVSYISTMVTLRPGDVVLTGTPGGVGRARSPQVFLRPGDRVKVTIDGIGSTVTTITGTAP
jgi:acylpyruvate hydrolase